MTPSTEMAAPVELDADTRARLLQLLARDRAVYPNAGRFVVDLLHAVYRTVPRMPRGAPLQNPLTGFDRHLQVVWDTHDLLHERYGPVTVPLMKALHRHFIDWVAPLDLRPGHVIEEGCWFGGNPPARYTIGYPPYRHDGYVITPLLTTGTARQWRDHERVPVLNGATADPYPKH